MQGRGTVLAATAALMVMGCSKVFLQDDGFSEKLHGGCKTEDACRQLQIEAEQRIIKCKDNTVGYVRCDDARADKLLADSYVQKYEHERVARKEAEQQARNDAREREMREAQQARRREQEQAERDRKRDQLRSSLEREEETVRRCEASKDARVARKRHAELVSASPRPGEVLKKQCTPRRESVPVRQQCTDENGFQRPCTRNVAGDVVGYTCPKTVDADVVKLGLYQLGLEDYPFPEDRQIGVRDDDCDRATSRAADLRERIGRVDEEGKHAQ